MHPFNGRVHQYFLPSLGQYFDAKASEQLDSSNRSRSSSDFGAVKKLRETSTRENTRSRIPGLPDSAKSKAKILRSLNLSKMSIRESSAVDTFIDLNLVDRNPASFCAGPKIQQEGCCEASLNSSKLLKGIQPEYYPGKLVELRPLESIKNLSQSQLRSKLSCTSKMPDAIDFHFKKTGKFEPRSDPIRKETKKRESIDPFNPSLTSWLGSKDTYQTPKFVQASQDRAGSTQAKIFDLRPKLIRKIKVHKFSLLNLINDEALSKSRCSETEKAEKQENTVVEQKVVKFAFKEQDKKSAPHFALVKQRSAEYYSKVARQSLNSELYTKRSSLPINLKDHKLSPIISDVSKKKMVKILSPVQDDFVIEKGTRYQDLFNQNKKHTTRVVELTSVKVKGKMQNGNPFSFDKSRENLDGFEETENKKRKVSFRSIVSRLLEHLKKIKMLKLTPEEVYGGQEVFSNVPYQKDGSKDLIKAAKSGKASLVEEILKDKGKYLVYDYDQIYQTALHWAAKGNFEDVACILIEYGADVDAKDIAGRTPLCLAIKKNSISVMKVLLAHGADPWSNEECNYKKLCGSNLAALYYITLAQQLSVLLRIRTALNLQKYPVWRKLDMNVIMTPKLEASQATIEGLFGRSVSFLNKINAQNQTLSRN